MRIPKESLSWKSGNIGLTLLGIWYMLQAFLLPSTHGAPTLSSAPAQGIFTFGVMFLAIALINAKSSPTVLGSIIAMLLGLSYFMGFVTNISIPFLWTMVLVMFVLFLVLELGVFKIGPSNSKAKLLTIVPMAVMGFTLLLGLAGYGPIHFPTNQWMSWLNLVAVFALCWVYVLDYVGYRPFKARTNLLLNILPLLAVLLSVIGIAQGALFSW